MMTLHKPIFLQWISKVDAKSNSGNKPLETKTRPASFQCRLYSIDGAALVVNVRLSITKSVCLGVQLQSHCNTRFIQCQLLGRYVKLLKQSK